MYAPELADKYDKTPADSLGGRFACHLCADNRDAAERAERDLDRAAALVDRAHALLRWIARLEPRPAAGAVGIEETPNQLALIGYAQALTAVKARIELHLEAVAAR
jgi:hypothetical protein